MRKTGLIMPQKEVQDSIQFVEIVLNLAKRIDKCQVTIVAKINHSQFLNRKFP